MGSDIDSYNICFEFMLLTSFCIFILRELIHIQSKLFSKGRLVSFGRGCISSEDKSYIMP